MQSDCEAIQMRMQIKGSSMDNYQRHELATIRVCPRMVWFSAKGWESDDNAVKALQHERLSNMLTPLPWVAGCWFAAVW